MIPCVCVTNQTEKMGGEKEVRLEKENRMEKSTATMKKRSGLVVGKLGCKGSCLCVVGCKCKASTPTPPNPTGIPLLRAKIFCWCVGESSRYLCRDQSHTARPQSVGKQNPPFSPWHGVVPKIPQLLLSLGVTALSWGHRAPAHLQQRPPTGT